MYYIPLIEIKDLNALIDNKLTHQKKQRQQDKTKQNKKQIKNLSKCQRMIKLIRLLTPPRLFKFIWICLSREENTSFLQQVNFTGKLEDDAANIICFC